MFLEGKKTKCIWKSLKQKLINKIPDSKYMHRIFAFLYNVAVPKLSNVLLPGSTD